MEVRVFGGSKVLQDRIVSGVAGAPTGHTALEAVALGLDAAGRPARAIRN